MLVAVCGGTGYLLTVAFSHLRYAGHASSRAHGPTGFDADGIALAGRRDMPKLALTLERPAIIVGRVAETQGVEAASLVVMDSGAGSDPQARIDELARMRFMMPVRGTRVEVVPRLGSHPRGAFSLSIAESAAARHARHTAQLTLRSGDWEGVRAFAMPAPGETLDLGCVEGGRVIPWCCLVVDPTGAPVSGARVYLRSGPSADDADGDTPESAVACADSRGLFSLDVRGVAAAVLIRAEGFLPGSVPWIDAAECTSDEVHRVVLQRVRASVRGRLALDGVEVQACTLSIVGRATEGSLRDVRVPIENDGHFSCHSLGPGGYSLQVESCGATFEAFAFRLADEDLDLGTVPFDLRGRVLLHDPNRALLSGDALMVRAEAEQDGKEVAWSWRAVLQVGEALPLMWMPLPAGAVLRHAEIVAPPRLGNQRQTLTGKFLITSVPQSVDLNFVALPEASTLLRALHREPDGSFRPLRLASFEAVDAVPGRVPDGEAAAPSPRQSPQVASWSIRGRTSSVGEFHVPVGPRDSFSITVEEPTWGDRLHWRGAPADTADGAIVFENAPCDLNLRIRDAEGHAVPSTLVQVVGKPALASREPSEVTRTLRGGWTDTRGEVSLGRVRPGWEFHVQYRPGREGGVDFFAAGSFQVPASAGGAYTAELALPGARIEGKALDLTGEPLRGRRLAVFSRRPGDERGRLRAATAPVVTSARGTWSFASVPPGSYVLAVMPDRGSSRIEAESEPFLVAGGRTDYEVRIVAPPARTAAPRQPNDVGGPQTQR